MAILNLIKQPTTGVLPAADLLEVKMFIHNDPFEAEKSVSAWLQQNDVMIQHLAQSQSEKNGAFVFVLSVFYIRES